MAAPAWESGSHGRTHPWRKLTRASLLLRDAGAPLPAPPQEISPPQQGRYRFLRACCGLRKAYLLALEPCAGMLFCLLPGRSEWTKLTPRGGHNTTTCSDSLPYAVWNVEALDLTGGTILIWPSDSGLLALRPNLVSMTYDVELLAPGRCVSPVLPVEKRFAVLTEQAGSVSLVAAGIDAKPETLVSGVPHSNWISAAASPWTRSGSPKRGMLWRAWHGTSLNLFPGTHLLWSRCCAMDLRTTPLIAAYGNRCFTLRPATGTRACASSPWGAALKIYSCRRLRVF